MKFILVRLLFLFLSIFFSSSIVYATDERNDQIIIKGKQYSVFSNTQVNRFNQLFVPVKIFTRTEYNPQNNESIFSFMVIKDDFKDADKKPVLDFFATTNKDITKEISLFIQQTANPGMFYIEGATQIQEFVQKYPAPFNLKENIGLFNFYESSIKECGSFWENHQAIWLIQDNKLYIKELGFYPCNPLVSKQIGQKKTFNRPVFASWYSGVFWIHAHGNDFKIQAIKINKGQIKWLNDCNELHIHNNWVLGTEEMNQCIGKI
jgi:hypothetical protein